jgi:hypothetical protein
MHNGANLYLLARTGERFGTRPSTLLQIEPDDPLALDVDIAADMHLRLLESQEVERIRDEMDQMKTRHGRR